MREFQASYDGLTKAISAVAVLVIAAAPVIAESWIVGLLSIPILVLAYGYSPRRYAVGQRSIRVERLLSSVELPLDRVQEARPVTPEDLRWTMRLWGSGGLFGYYGTFRTSKLGKCTWYCTRRSNQVVVVTDSQTSLFTPDDPVRFLAAIRAESPGLDGQVTQSGPQSSLRKDLGAYAWLIGAIAIPGVILAIAAIRYAPGQPSVRLTGDSLEIQDRFYPVTLQRGSVDLDSARPVSIADPEWRVTRRTNGFANSHYRSGWFRTANGNTVRMYRATGEQLLLLPGKAGGDTVLLEVPDAAAFLGAMRNQWGSAPRPDLP